MKNENVELTFRVTDVAASTAWHSFLMTKFCEYTGTHKRRTMRRECVASQPSHSSPKSRFSRAWAWMKKRVFRIQTPTQTGRMEVSLSTPSDDFSIWDDAIIIQPIPQSARIEPVVQQQTQQRKRFRDKILEREHFAIVTKALIDEELKNCKEEKTSQMIDEKDEAHAL